MGRHRRTASAGGATDRAAAATDPHSPWEPWESPVVRTPRRAHRHRRRASGSVRTGLLGASAAVAVGTIAVTSGMLSGGSPYSIGGDDGSDRVRSLDTPSDLRTLGDTESPRGTPSATHPDADRPTGKASGTPSASGSRDAPGTSGRAARPTHPTARETAPANPTTPTPSRGTTTTTPSHSPAPKPGTPTAKPTQSTEQAAAQQVLTLVNQERSKAGCSPLRSDSALAHLASAFSAQMADEDFFDHTDPAGLSPWDRAAKAGITNLGGENIARGQSDAAAVMDAWMNSAGHRANILNCDYRTIGIGVHFGAGGPWWTQDFGF